MRKLTRAEARLTEAAAPPSGSPQEAIAEAIGKLGDQPELRTLSALVVAAGLLATDRRLVRTGIRMLLAHELATLGKNLVKEQIDRTRPRSAKLRRDQMVKPGKHTAKSKTSFPSGHSAGTVAVARAVGREYPALEAPALLVAAIVGGLQVPRLAHYPTDVVAGMAVGATSEAVANLVFLGAEDET